MFSGLIILPTINGVFHFFKEENSHENRNKAKLPVFNVSKLDAFVKEYDSYYSDNFSLRENGISFHNKFEYFLWGVSPVPNEVIVGKNGWFYDKDCTENYSGANAFTKEELLQIEEELSYRSEWAASKNIKYYVAIVPSKMNVYPEYLPSKIIKVSNTSQYDQVVSLDKKSTINIIDIRKNLLSHKNDGYDLFQHTDGHWNDFGAYFGYQEIINRLSKDFPELKPSDLKDYTISLEQRPGGSIVSMINLEKEFPENFVKLTEKDTIYAYDGIKRPYERPATIPEWDHQIIKVNDHGKKIKCLIIRDSFTLLLIRFLQENFKESVFIHDEWKYRMREDLIEKEKPDVVINIVFETGLNKLIEFPFKKK